MNMFRVKKASAKNTWFFCHVLNYMLPYGRLQGVGKEGVGAKMSQWKKRTVTNILLSITGRNHNLQSVRDRTKGQTKCQMDPGSVLKTLLYLETLVSIPSWLI